MKRNHTSPPRVYHITMKFALLRPVPPRSPNRGRRGRGKEGADSHPSRPQAPLQAAPTKWPIRSSSSKQSILRANRYSPSRTQLGQLAGKPNRRRARSPGRQRRGSTTAWITIRAGADKQGFVASFQVTGGAARVSVRYEIWACPRRRSKRARREGPALQYRQSARHKNHPRPAHRVIQDTWARRAITGRSGKVTALTAIPSHRLPAARNLSAVAQVTFTGNQGGAASVLRRRRPRVPSARRIPTPGSANSWTARSPVYEQRAACGSRLRSADRGGERRGRPARSSKWMRRELPSWARSRSGPARMDPAALLKRAISNGDVANFDRVTRALERIRKAVWRAEVPTSQGHRRAQDRR